VKDKGEGEGGSMDGRGLINFVFHNEESVGGSLLEDLQYVCSV